MKRFLVILGIVALVWLGVSMAEEKPYPMQVRVQMVGYDTIRYAAVQSDTLLPLQVTMSGWSAFLTTLSREAPLLKVEVPDGQNAVAVASLGNELRRTVLGARRVESDVDSLRVVLSPRARRSYRPKLDDVEFSFSEQYGLYGEPRITPAVVDLYGPAEALSQIDEVKVAATSIRNIKGNASYTLALDPVWQAYPDVHPSCDEVTITLPVEAYVEREFRLPVQVLDADSSVALKLYPAEVTLRAWVAQRDLHRDPAFTVAVDYRDVFLHEGRLEPRLVEFPSYVRPRYLEPSEIQCVVIR